MRIDTIVLMLISLTSLGAVHFFEKMAIQSGAPPAPFALGQTAIALLALWPVWLWRQQQPAHAPMLRSGRLGALMLIGILAGLLSALAMGFFYWSVRRKGPSIAAGMLAAAPIVTATLEWWWLGERFVGAQLTGIAMVIAGVATLSRQHALSRTDD